MEKRKTLILLDMHAILHRGYHALPDFVSTKGEPTGALYGLMALLFKMAKDLHPDYHEITVVMTDGTEFVTRSTYQTAGARIQLDIDSKSHPAYTGQHRLVDRGGQLAKFNKRFSGLGTKSEASAEGAASKPAEKAEKIKLTTGAKKKA